MEDFAISDNVAILGISLYVLGFALGWVNSQKCLRAISLSSTSFLTLSLFTLVPSIQPASLCIYGRGQCPTPIAPSAAYPSFETSDVWKGTLLDPKNRVFADIGSPLETGLYGHWIPLFSIPTPGRPESKCRNPPVVSIIDGDFWRFACVFESKSFII